jgi:hypothetical protein
MLLLLLMTKNKKTVRTASQNVASIATKKKAEKKPIDTGNIEI